MEWERAQRILSPPKASDGEAIQQTDEQKAALRTMQEAVQGRMAVEELPDDLSWQMLLRKVGIAPHLFFDDDLYTAQERGMILAEQIISGRLDFVRRVADEMDRNRREAARRRAQKKQKDRQQRTRRGRARTRRTTPKRPSRARVKRR